jgi:hypothetical protein
MQKQIKYLNNFVKLEIINEGQYLLYTISKNDQLSIDVYIDDVMERLEAWEQGNLYILHDMSADNVSLTPYFQRRLNEVAAYLRSSEKQGYSAVILPDTFASALISLFAQLFNRKNGHFSQRIFTTLDKGKEWIAENMTERAKVSST